MFHADSFSIIDRKSNTVLFKGPCLNGLYPITATLDARKGFVAHLVAKVSHLLWHNRLGHPSNNVLHALCKQSCISFNFASDSCICSHCLHGKMSKLLFSLSRSICAKPLSLGTGS